MEMERKPPSLVQICLQTAIDNIRYIGNVGDMDAFLLKDLLPHANVEQLMNIEDATEGRDLSPVTDELWKRFYKQTFGVESMDLVVKRMKGKRVVFKWRQLYESKTKEREEAQRKSVEKFRQRYAEDLARKQSRQVQFTMKDPPSRKRRFSEDGYSRDACVTGSSGMRGYVENWLGCIHPCFFLMAWASKFGLAHQGDAGVTVKEQK